MALSSSRRRLLTLAQGWTSQEAVQQRPCADRWQSSKKTCAHRVADDVAPSTWHVVNRSLILAVDRSEGFPHPGQCAQGCVEITSTVSWVSLISTWPMTIPSGKGRNGDLSISIILLKSESTLPLSRSISPSINQGSKQALFPKSWDEP